LAEARQALLRRFVAAATGFRYPWAMQAVRAVALCMVILVGCNSGQVKHPKRLGETIRYRLLLRDNPVSPADAAHCFAACQSARAPNQYVDCLSQCPGFETTPGEYCSNTEVPPVAACLTVRKIPAKSEPPPGLVVLAVIGEVALVVGAASLCKASSSRCNLYPPPQ
jgi:hypothetical protein